MTHTLVAHKDGVDAVVFDGSFLEIGRATIKGKEVNVDVAERDHVLGNAITVKLPSKLKRGSSIDLKIEYSTTEDCTAIGWLEPE